MARNAEKAMTTLARWRAAQGVVPQKAKRPFLASECDDVRDCEKWRKQILSELSRKVAQIQNAGLGEFRIRDLNDEINKLLREKGHWEARIKELGGPDHARFAPKIIDTDGQEAPGNRGYMYFGAAKDLPGVRELFEQEPAQGLRKTRGELMKDVDADYYGLRDEDDGIIVPLEVKLERKLMAKAAREYKLERLKEEGREDMDIDEDKELDEEEEEQLIAEQMDERTEVLRFMAHVPNIPTQADIEAAMLNKKKKELLQQILGE